jgi:peptide deformylase
MTIVQYPADILSSPAKKVEAEDFPLMRDLVFEMRTEMTKHKGVGIAANQIGSPFAVCIVYDRTMINPKITVIDADNWTTRDEGCLSIFSGGKLYPRTASDRVQVNYQDIRGHKKTHKFYSFEARIVQHELRHLEGLLINEGFEDE